MTFNLEKILSVMGISSLAALRVLLSRTSDASCIPRQRVTTCFAVPVYGFSSTSARSSAAVTLHWITDPTLTVVVEKA